MSKYFHVRYKPKPERTLEQMPTAELAAGINHILDTLRARGVVVRDYDDKDRRLYKIQMIHGRPFFLASEEDNFD
jgi:hypothetical protein